MSSTFLAAYVLVWPVVVAVVLFVLIRAFLSEWRHARRAGRSII